MSRRSKQLVGQHRRLQRRGELRHDIEIFARHRLLDEGRRELFDIAQDLDGAKGRQRLVVVDAQIDLVAEFLPDRREVVEILVMRFHAGLDLVDDVAVRNHLSHALEIGGEIGIGD